MKKAEKLEVLKREHLGEFVKTRKDVFDELSNECGMFCCCGRLATGLHQTSCRKFNDWVDSETIERLSYLM